MERAEQLFVEAVSVSLENKSVSWKEPLTLNEWQRIFILRSHIMYYRWSMRRYSDAMQ